MKRPDRIIFIRLHSAAVLFLLASAVLLSGCLTLSRSVEMSVGRSATQGPVSVTVTSRDEGVVEIRMRNSSENVYRFEIRPSYPAIGYDASSTGGNTSVFAILDVSRSSGFLEPGTVTEETVRLQNWFDVNRSFQFTVQVDTRFNDNRYRFNAKVYDEDLYTNLELLRRLNQTDYRHPRLIKQNWELYMKSVDLRS